MGNSLNSPQYYTWASVITNAFEKSNHSGDLINLEAPQNSLYTAH